MTFENGVFTHVHTVSWPSCWLPPSHCVKVLLMGMHTDQIDQLVHTAHQRHPHLSWCFYFVDSLSPLTEDQQHWLMINSAHVAAVCSSLQPTDVITALCCDHACTCFVENSGSTPAAPLVFAGHAIVELSQLLTQIINHTQESIQR